MNLGQTGASRARPRLLGVQGQFQPDTQGNDAVLEQQFRKVFPLQPARRYSSCFSLSFLVAPVHAEQWQKLNPQGYVNDFAGVLNATTVEGLTRLGTEVDQKAKAQIAVVTIKTLEGDTVEDFANHLFQKWGVGAKGTDRGVMVLLATDDHKYWTEVGYGLEPILPDGKVGGFGRSMVPLLRQGDYNAAVLQMVSQIAQVIAQDSHVSLDSLADFHAVAPAASEARAENSPDRRRDHFSCYYLHHRGAHSYSSFWVHGSCSLS